MRRPESSIESIIRMGRRAPLLRLPPQPEKKVPDFISIDFPDGVVYALPIGRTSSVIQILAENPDKLTPKDDLLTKYIELNPLIERDRKIAAKSLRGSIMRANDQLRTSRVPWKIRQVFKGMVTGSNDEGLVLIPSEPIKARREVPSWEVPFRRIEAEIDKIDQRNAEIQARLDMVKKGEFKPGDADNGFKEKWRALDSDEIATKSST